MTNRPLTLPGVLGSILLLHLVLVFPAHPDALTVATFLRLPVELPAILCLVLIFRAGWVRALVVVGAVAVLLLRIADQGSYQAFGRPFNPALDLHLLVSGWDLLSGSIGLTQAFIAIALALAVVALFAVLLRASLRGLARVDGVARAVTLGLGAMVLALGLAMVVTPDATLRASADLYPRMAQRIARMTRSVRDLRAFTADLDRDDVGNPTFAALDGRDVIIVFIESYGRSFVDAPEFAGPAQARLTSVQDRLRAAGWDMRSAWSGAPTRGGQSWLAHGATLSGLWTDNQARYDRLMASDRRSLNRLFRDAGWRTGAAMPAITLDWPESAWFGYDTTLDAEGLQYRGQPFEWVTMPDQYTLTAMDRMLRTPGPDMIEVALITSHAPWTPLPRILPWDDIGDGSVFDGTHRDGATPREVWSDPVRIKAQYALALDYALEIVGQYIARQGDGALFVVLGDHQPARLLTGDGASADVPLHVISDDPALLDRLPADLFTPGMIPSPADDTLRMDRLRALFATIFE